MAKAYRLLGAIMRTAVEDELIRQSPCRIKGAGVESSPERQVATLAQVYEIAHHIDPRYRALVLLATFGSLRWGGLLGLHRADVDLEARTVRVRRTYQEVAGKLVLGLPKSAAGTRTVAVPSLIVPELQWHLQRFAEEGQTGRVFVGPKGATPRRANFNLIWRKATVAVVCRISTSTTFDTPGRRWRPRPAPV